MEKWTTTTPPSNPDLTHGFRQFTRYDAERTVAAFAARLKDTVDLDSVRDDLAGVVDQALEPAHVSLRVNERG